MPTPAPIVTITPITPAAGFAVSVKIPGNNDIYVFGYPNAATKNDAVENFIADMAVIITDLQSQVEPSLEP